ncbi:MAG TPA: caspase family protein [Blastocatellia bacterium]|nr:caspase family protein [Blastocatellia bacterium]
MKHNRLVLWSLLILALSIGASPSPSKSATGAQRKAPPADQQWALLVGVSDYPGQIQKLQFPRNDAIAIKDLLISAAGFREDHIRLLTDSGAGELKATKQNILTAIDQYLGPRVQAGHQVIVFLGGHGIVRGLGTQAHSYFLPADVDAQSKESLERTGLDLEELSAKLGALKASQFTIFVDACREDPFPGRGIKGNTMTDVMARGLVVKRSQSETIASTASDAPTQVIFYSCQVGERAYEDPNLKHGVFTYYILRGIRELAGPPEGVVDAGQLAAYLRDNVRRWGEEFKQQAKFPVEQTPMMVASQVKGPMAIVRITPAAGKPASPLNTGTLLLLTSPEGAALKINGESQGQGPLTKELPPGQYTVRAEMADFQPVELKIDLLAGYQQEFTLTLSPPKGNANYDKGLRFESQGLWPQAIVAYEMALQEDPTSVASYQRLGNAYTHGGRYRDSVDLLSQAVQRLPNNAGVLARYSRSLSAWAQIDEKQDVSVNPRPDKAIKQKDARKEAVRAAETAAQKAASLEDAQLALGYAYVLEEADRAKALSSFVRASTIAPEDAEAYFGVGYTYRLLKQYEQAVPQLKKALELRPGYYEAHRELAYCYHSSGDSDSAVAEYHQAEGYRGETSDSGEMAGNQLALSALYTEKGQQVGGSEGEQYKKAGAGYGLEAREMDPTLKLALKTLANAGLTSRMENYLPADVRRVLNDIPSNLPGKIKIPFKRP